MGDFNEIIDNSEKQGGTIRPESSFVDFRSFLSESNLYDLPHSGNFYSWRLDRSIANCSWFEIFPATRSEYLCFKGSDHMPIVSYLSGNKKKRPKGLFRFDRWLKDNEVIQWLVLETWNTMGERSIEQRIGRSRITIIQWNTDKQQNSQNIVLQKQEKLELEDNITVINNISALKDNTGKIFYEEQHIT